MKTSIRTLQTLSLLGLAAATAQAQIPFTAAPSLAAAQRPSGAAAGDFNGDGLTDLAVTVDTQDRLLVFPGTGGGNFGAPAMVFLGANAGAHTPVAGDFDQDGDLDVAVSQHNQNNVVILANNGGVFTSAGTVPAGAEARHMIGADMNGDGRLDLVVSNRSGNTVSVLTSLGGLSFASASFAAGQEPRHVAAGDVDADGDLDVLVSAHDSRAVLVLRNTAGSLATAATLPVPFNEKPDGAVLADLDGDGDLDAAATADQNGASFVVVWRNTGGTFGGATTTFTNGQNSSAMAAADLDGDGDVDLAVSNEDASDITVLANTGAGAFAAPQLIATGLHPEAILAADVDNDGDVDLVVPNRDSNTVSILLGQGGAGGPVTYCTPKTNSLGCVPSLSAFGSPTAGATSGFQVACANVRNNKAGLMFYGLSGRAALPFQGGTLCVATPILRTPARSAGGNPAPADDCSGAWVIDMNQFAAGLGGGNPAPALSQAGTVVDCQWWGRDQGFPAPNNTALSAGLEYTVQP